MRDFKKMETDEMYALWLGYLKTDWSSYDPLNLRSHIPHKIPIRLTPIEITKLVEEIFERLLRKEGYEVQENE